MSKLPLDYFQTDDVLQLSRDLLGKYTYTCVDNQITAGMIVETEAYRAPEDKASHAYNLRKTNRNNVMYNLGGCIYIYMCYGLYSLLNIVSNQSDIPHAILIRAIEPVIGIDIMLQRRGKTSLDKNLTAGPGVLTIALGITKSWNGLLLTGPEIWIEDQNRIIREDEIIASPRVGIAYAQEHVQLPWRFRLKNNPFTSPAK